VLTRLHIENFALIEGAEIEFGPGLNVITGETGAGKSILIGALNSILGGPASADLVRDGSPSCSVEGLFELDPDSPTARALAGLGVELPDGQLVLRREIRSNGRSRAFANQHLTPIRSLRQIGARLVDLHGQHEHQSLLDPAHHVRFLDECGGLGEAARAVADAFGEYRQSDDRVALLRAERQSLREAEELRQYQLEEIRRLAPQPGETESLERELKVLEHQSELAEGASALHAALYGDEEATVTQLGRARRELERLAQVDPALQIRAEAIAEVLYRLEDVAEGLRDYGDSLEMDPERLEEARQRLEELRRLCQRHGGSLEEVLARADELEAQEERSEGLDQALAQAEAQRQTRLDEFAAACRELSAGRVSAAGVLSREVQARLVDLGMAEARFEVSLERAEADDGLLADGETRYAADETGSETVEFHISANRGERLLPLASVASGGEISRIMLVLKSIIAEGDAVGTLVFDEIDAGISGRVAAAVGRRLAELSGSHQTILITHLPQIASLAEQHFAVRKELEGDRTATRVVELGATERAEEIAQLLAGDTVSETARRHAREMLE